MSYKMINDVSDDTRDDVRDMNNLIYAITNIVCLIFFIISFKLVY
jgi:hypothetical protein